MSIKDLKNELKVLAKDITESKAECKKNQREGNSSNACTLQLAIIQKKYYFRHKHIAYCSLRGTKYEEIECNCSRAGDPNWDFIKEDMDAHKTVQDVRACA